MRVKLTILSDLGNDASTQGHLDYIEDKLEPKLRRLEIDFRDFCMNGGDGELR